MHEVICNTSPLQYLYQIDLLHVLPARFRRVLVPDAVQAELTAGARRNVVLPDLEHLDWVTIKATHVSTQIPVGRLGIGERAVLSLGTKMPQAVLLLDDKRARRYASIKGMNFTGTLGMVLVAKQRRIIPSVTTTLDRLVRCGFRLSEQARHKTIELAGEAA